MTVAGQLTGNGPSAPGYLAWLTSTGFTQQQIAKLIRTVLATKNLRSHLTSVQPILRSNAGPYMAGALSIGVEMDLTNFVGAT